jgi:hypothetical protein
MKGKHRPVEFINYLAELLDLGAKNAQFAKRIGKKPQNVSGYLSGGLVPGKRVLQSSLRHAFEWEVAEVVEIRPVREHASKLPEEPGIYALYDSSGSAIYVGQASNLKSEVAQTLQREMNFPVRLGPRISRKEHRRYKDVAAYVSAYKVPSPRMRHNLEALLLRVFPNQSHNNKMGNFR